MDFSRTASVVRGGWESGENKVCSRRSFLGEGRLCSTRCRRLLERDLVHSRYVRVVFALRTGLLVHFCSGSWHQLGLEQEVEYWRIVAMECCGPRTGRLPGTPAEHPSQQGASCPVSGCTLVYIITGLRHV
jgi:predicted nucleic acid-binding Zn ribbon protein